MKKNELTKLEADNIALRNKRISDITSKMDEAKVDIVVHNRERDLYLRNLVSEKKLDPQKNYEFDLEKCLILEKKEEENSLNNENKDNKK